MTARPEGTRPPEACGPLFAGSARYANADRPTYLDAVAAKALDRLCRSQSLGPWGTIAETPKRAGVDLFARGLRLNLHDPTQVLMFTMVGPAFAGFEKAVIMGRLKNGQRPSSGVNWSRPAGAVTPRDRGASQRRHTRVEI